MQNDQTDIPVPNNSMPPKRGLWIAIITALTHLILAAFFFFRPDDAVYVINAGPRIFKGFDEVPVTADRFWLTFGSFYFLTSGVYLLHGAVSKYSKSAIGVTLFTKALVIAAFGYQFMYQARIFSYLGGIILESILLFPLLISLFRLIRQDSQRGLVE